MEVLGTKLRGLIKKSGNRLSRNRISVLKIVISVVAFIGTTLTLITTHVYPDFAQVNRTSIVDDDIRSSQDNQYDFRHLWKKLDSYVSKDGIYPRGYDVEEALGALRTAPILKIEPFKVQTSYKWLLTLEGGHKAIYKIMLVQQSQLFQAANMGCEHPEYEVAGFTITRMLGLRNMAYVTGRTLSWFKDAKPVASQELKDSMYTVGDDVCFNFTCLHTLQPHHYCFKDGIVRGALIFYLNETIKVMGRTGGDLQRNHFPCDRAKLKNRSISFEHTLADDSNCSKFRTKAPYNDTEHFLHAIDVAVISYILQNMDSYHTYIIRDKTLLMNVQIDFGLAFSILRLAETAPMYQCCMIRKSTYEALLSLKDTMTTVFHDITRKDPLYPVLLPELLRDAHDRLRHLLQFLDFCATSKGLSNVLI